MTTTPRPLSNPTSPQISSDEVLGLLGAGGKGQVLLARRAASSERVAIEVLLDPTNGDAATRGGAIRFHARSR